MCINTQPYSLPSALSCQYHKNTCASVVANISLSVEIQVPAQPSNFEAETELDTRIQLTWLWPVQDPIIKYELLYWEADSENKVSRQCLFLPDSFRITSTPDIERVQLLLWAMDTNERQPKLTFHKMTAGKSLQSVDRIRLCKNRMYLSVLSA